MHWFWRRAVVIGFALVAALRRAKTIRRCAIGLLLVCCLLSLAAWLVSFTQSIHVQWASSRGKESVLIRVHDGLIHVVSVNSNGDIRLDLLRENMVRIQSLREQHDLVFFLADRKSLRASGRSHFGYDHDVFGRRIPVHVTTLRIPGWCPVVLFGLYPVAAVMLALYRRRRRQQVESGLNCDQTGNTNGCPEGEERM